MRSHLGTSFTIWNRRHTWLWMVRNQHGESGAIGTAATEAEAVREACASIEEWTAQHPTLLPAPGAIPGKALVPMPNRLYSCDASLGWMDWWVSVAHLITGKILTRWADVVLRSN
jgi:hypothetical protein